MRQEASMETCVVVGRVGILSRALYADLQGAIQDFEKAREQYASCCSSSILLYRHVSTLPCVCNSTCPYYQLYHVGVSKNLLITIHIALLQRNTLEYSAFRSCWREHQLSMIHFACVYEAGRSQFMRALYDIVLGKCSAVNLECSKMPSLS